MSAAVPALLEELRRALGDRLGDALVTTDYPFQQRKLPPDRPLVWLGVEKISASSDGLSPYLGEEPDRPGLPGSAAMGRELELDLRLEVLDRQDGSACHRVFGELAELLLLGEGFPRVREVSCGATAFDREAGAFRLVCRGKLRALLLRTEDSPAITGVVVEKADDER